MTDREKAIVMAYTGFCMLSGDKYNIFHKYVEDIMGRTVYTHELADKMVIDEIKEKAKDDFIALCADTTTDEYLIGHGDEFYNAFKPLNDPRAIYISEALDMAIKALEQEPCEDIGEVSDGYHTFNQLYHQRAVLFATIVNQNKDIAWKSFKHHDGKYCFDSDGKWFIVGVDTPQGSYTYHYEKKYWDMFDCKELECGKEWDGHTEEDVTRLLSLQQK